MPGWMHARRKRAGGGGAAAGRRPGGAGGQAGGTRSRARALCCFRAHSSEGQGGWTGGQMQLQLREPTPSTLLPLAVALPAPPQISEDDLDQALLSAIKCAILAAAGPQRSRMLATLYKARPYCSAAPRCGVLQLMLGLHVSMSGMLVAWRACSPSATCCRGIRAC